MNDKTRTLSARGIGKRYHKMSLADYPHTAAKEVLDWINTEEYKNGQGAFIQGQTHESYDIAILAARGLILSGLPRLEVINFTHACKDETLSSLTQDPRPVLITEFLPATKLVEGNQYKLLEAQLTYLFDNNIPVLFHNSMTEQYEGYASTCFVSRIESINKIFSI